MRFALSFLLLALLIAPPAHAEDYAPDDVVMLDLSTEGFVTTKTAQVTVNVNAAGDEANASAIRADMQKAVAGLAEKADWRLISFNRMQDEAGLTRWLASYQARLPEQSLNGLADRAKKLGRSGMQLQVANTEFTPTLEEAEAKRAELRQALYAQAMAELKRLNDSMPGRAFRLGSISFGGAGGFAPPPMPMMMAKGMRADMAYAAEAAQMPPSAEVAQQLRVTARVTYAARPMGK